MMGSKAYSERDVEKMLRRLGYEEISTKNHRKFRKGSKVIILPFSAKTNDIYVHIGTKLQKEINGTTN